PVCDGRLRIDHARVPRTHQITRDDFTRRDVVDLFLQFGSQCTVAKEGVDFVLTGRLVERQVQNCHADVWRRYPDRITGELARELWQGFDGRFGSTGFGDHHIQG